MKISELFAKKTVFSFEIFPPKKTSSIETIYKMLDELKDLKPDFISVTYGAGGNLADTRTIDIATRIKQELGVETAMHLTCINNSQEDVSALLQVLQERGIENILALRGDINPDVEPKKDFPHAADLIRYIRKHGSFDIAGACYPEGHIEAPDLDTDIRYLKQKVDAGAEHLISQLFFDNHLYFEFLEKARAAGIQVPIEAGIMPVVNKKSIERMVTLCGASLPSKFTKMMQRYENHPDALRDAGIAYAINQIIDLVAQGVDGIHLYTMNNPYVAGKITESVSGLMNLDAAE